MNRLKQLLFAVQGPAWCTSWLCLWYILLTEYRIHNVHEAMHAADEVQLKFHFNFNPKTGCSDRQISTLMSQILLRCSMLSQTTSVNSAL